MNGIIYIVIPVFNRLNYTIACLNSLNAQTLKNQIIIVVDHGSSDGTSEILKKDFPGVVLVKGDESLWWTGATNLGVKKALELSQSEQDLILTLNNDLEVDEDYLSELLEVYKDNIPCIVGSTSVDISNSEKITFIGGTWNKYTAKFKRSILADLKYSEVAAGYKSIEADLLPGRGVLIPLMAFKKLGLYDEKNFPHYSADDDFSLRCKINGYKLLVAVRAVVKSHTEATGISSIRTISFWNRLYSSLTSIKSPNRLSTRYKWAKLHAPLPFMYILFDFLRIVGSALKSLYRSKSVKA
jgi:GT2 family glycosyltransferase